MHSDGCSMDVHIVSVRGKVKRDVGPVAIEWSDRKLRLG